jgi:putative membrane protein
MIPLLAEALVTPSNVWTAWAFDVPVVTVLLVVSAIYVRGAVRLRARRGSAALGHRVAAFAAAMVAVVVALVSPLDGMAGILLSAHMVQHLLLIVVAPPLFVLSRPGVTAAAGGVPRQVRHALHAPVLRTARRVRTAVRQPVAAWCVSTILLWGWHLPAAFDAALRSDALHALEHLTFLLGSMLVWSVALERTERGAGRGGRALFLAAAALQGAVLGAILLFARVPLYEVPAGGPAAWGLTPLQDQQLAGTLMWIPPSIVYLFGAAATLSAWFRDMDASAASRSAERPPRSAAIEGSASPESVDGAPASAHPEVVT